MNGTLENSLRDRLNAYAETVTPASPDLPGATLTAARLDRRRNRIVAAGSAAALVVVAVGVTAAARTGHKVARPTAGEVVTTLPGLAPLAAVTLPADFEPTSVSQSDGQIWATGYQYAAKGESGIPVAIHGVPGSLLAPPSDHPSGATGAVVRGSHVYLSVNDGGKYVLQTRDADTGILLHQVALSTLGMDSGTVVPTGDGTGPLVEVMEKSEPDPNHPGQGTSDAEMRVGVIDVDGSIAHLSPIVSTTPPAAGKNDNRYQIGDTGGGALSPLVHLDGDVPHYLFYGDQRLDLTTGRADAVVPDSAGVATPNLTGMTAVGEVDGQVVWDTGSYGTQHAPASSLTLTAAGGVPPVSPSPDNASYLGLTLADGRLFRATDEVGNIPFYEHKGPFVPTHVEELDSSTLAPDDQTGVITAPTIADGSTIATYAAGRYSSKGQGLGGSLTVFAPVTVS